LHAARPADLAVIEVIDRTSWLVLQSLAASGMIAMAEGQSRVLHRSPEFDVTPAAAADTAASAVSAA
jgi:hypothetical protein